MRGFGGTIEGYDEYLSDVEELLTVTSKAAAEKRLMNEIEDFEPYNEHTILSVRFKEDETQDGRILDLMFTAEYSEETRDLERLKYFSYEDSR